MPQTVEDGAADWQRLAQVYAHPRDARISFYEPTHTYSIDGDSTGWISCTGFVHSFFGHFDADATIVKILRGRRYRGDPTYKYYGMSAGAIKAQWEASGAEASGAGTRMHLDIEHHYNAEPQGNVEGDAYEVAPGTEWDYFTRYEREFVEPRGWHAHRTEWLVFEEGLKLCGSIDMVYAKPDGTFAIYDWKRSKEIKTENDFQSGLGPLAHLPDTNLSHYTMQLNVYRALLQRNYGITVNELALVILHPNNESYRVIPLPFMDAEVEGMLGARAAALAVPGNAGHAPSVLWAQPPSKRHESPPPTARGGWAGAASEEEEAVVVGAPPQGKASRPPANRGWVGET